MRKFDRSRRIVHLFFPAVFALAFSNSPQNAQGTETQFSSQEMATIRGLSPDQLPRPPTARHNRVADDPRAARLGKTLFSDPRFSGRLMDGDNDGGPHSLGRAGETGKVACSSCHEPQHGFTDHRTLGAQISLAAGWGRRKTPSLLDVAQAPLFMWDGRHDSLESQILSVIESPFEMNSSRLHFAYKVFENHREEYEIIFGKMPDFSNASRFPALAINKVGCHFANGQYGACISPQRGGPGDQQEFDHLRPADKKAVTRVVLNAGKALAAYERLLTCGPGRFDRWAHGKADDLSESEQRGLKLFLGKAKCINCHAGPFFSDFGFHNIGLSPAIVATVFRDANDPGAAVGQLELQKNALSYLDSVEVKRFMKQPAENLIGAFKTPQLRCLSKRPAYFHTGQTRKLSEVVDFFNGGGSPPGSYPGKKEVGPLDLNSTESDDLVHFLFTLDGEDS